MHHSVWTFGQHPVTRSVVLEIMRTTGARNIHSCTENISHDHHERGLETQVRRPLHLCPLRFWKPLLPASVTLSQIWSLVSGAQGGAITRIMRPTVRANELHSHPLLSLPSSLASPLLLVRREYTWGLGACAQSSTPRIQRDCWLLVECFAIRAAMDGRRACTPNSGWSWVWMLRSGSEDLCCVCVVGGKRVRQGTIAGYRNCSSRYWF